MASSKPQVSVPSAAGPAGTKRSFFHIAARHWLPPLIWTALILWASGDQLGTETTSPWVQWLLTTLFGTVSAAKVDLIHRALRKLGHVVAYALLSWLALRAARATAHEHSGNPARWKWRWAALALGLVLFTSSSDELLQSYSKERTGTYRDVALDCFGAILAQGVLLVAARRKR
ncbi:MAG TPA: VanZ family protein [Terriglobales bacterium]|nr:VanZ family protein [Terriglobales bacterium]